MLLDDCRNITLLGDGSRPSGAKAEFVPPAHRGRIVKELLRSNELVLISWVQALLTAEGIEPVVLDSHASVLQGSTYAIPRRVMVGDGDNRRARQIITDAGEGGRLRPE